MDSQLDPNLTTRLHRLGGNRAWRVVIVARDGGPRWALDTGDRLVSLGENAALASQALSVLQRHAWDLPAEGLPSGELLLSPVQCAELYEQLTGRPLKYQRFQQWAKRGDVRSEIEVFTRAMIPASEVERLVREGLPDRGVGGRPRKDTGDNDANTRDT